MFYLLALKHNYYLNNDKLDIFLDNVYKTPYCNTHYWLLRAQNYTVNSQL